MYFHHRYPAKPLRKLYFNYDDGEWTVYMTVWVYQRWDDVVIPQVWNIDFVKARQLDADRANFFHV